MPDFGSMDPEKVQAMRDLIEQSSSHKGPTSDPEALRKAAEERHRSLQAQRETATVTDGGGRKLGEIPLGAPRVPGPVRKPLVRGSDSGSKGRRIVAQCEASGEPYFVFRAHDIFSIMILAKYAKILEDYAPDDPDMLAGVVDRLAEFKEWQKENVAQVRYPD